MRKGEEVTAVDTPVIVALRNPDDRYGETDAADLDGDLYDGR